MIADPVRVAQCLKLVQAAYLQFSGAANAIPAECEVLGTLWVVEGGQKYPFGFVCFDGPDLFIAIRGTRTALEWIDDAFVVQRPFEFGNVATGFGNLAAQILPQIDEILKGVVSLSGSVFVTGHSLGGPLALLTAIHIRALKPTAITFSSPRAGDLSFAQAFLSLSIPVFRVFNTEDIVPTVPMATTNPNSKISGLFERLTSLIHPSENGLFEHVGEPLPLTYNDGSLDANHSLDVLAAKLQKATP
jgi:triacylglycerol lipase